MAIALPAAAQNPTTPGAIPNPGTYQGSMALQQQESAASQAQAQQNAAMQSRLDETYRQYAPGRSNGAPPIDWYRQPALPPAKNPLLGHWRQGPFRPPTTKQLSQQLGPLAGLMAAAGGDGGGLNDFLEAGCDTFFGKGSIIFEPSSLKLVAPDGREEVHNHVAYRSRGRDVVVLTPDMGAMQAFFIGFPNHDHALVAFLNCTLDREGAGGAPPPQQTAQGRPGTQLANAPLPAAPPPSGPANATVRFQIGVSAPGHFTPLVNAPLWVMTQDPQATFNAAGLTLPPGTPLLTKLANDCATLPVCQREVAAVVHGALGRLFTDQFGQAQTPQIAAGRYYVVAVSNIQGRPVVWAQPVNVKPGANMITLDQLNGRQPQ